MQMSYPLDNTLYTATYPQLWLSTRTNGVFSGDNDLICTATGGMSISISPGIAWLSPERFMGAVFGNTENVSFELDIGDGVLHRIDRVVLRWDFIGNSILLDVKQGTPASTPVAPELQRDIEAFELGLHDISIRAGTISLIQGNVSDLRMNESLCGIMRDGVTGIPSQQFFDAWYSWFSSLQMDAETRAQAFTEWLTLFRNENEQEVIEWVANFKQATQASFDSWFNSFVSESTSIYTSWYHDFVSNSEDSFALWFQNLQDTLDDNQATGLFNKIQRHEDTSVVDEEGVHGFRVYQSELQIFIDGIWVSLMDVPTGLTAGAFDGRGFTAMAFDMEAYTAEIFDSIRG